MLQLGRAFDFSEIAWELVPDSGVFSGERIHFAALVFAVAGYVVGLLLGESGLVSVLVACLYVVVNMVWSVFTGCVAYVMHLYCCSEYVEVCDAEDLQSVHEWFCVCSGRGSTYVSDDAFMYSDEGLYVCFMRVVSAPDGYVADQVWIDVCVVLFSHSIFV